MIPDINAINDAIRRKREEEYAAWEYANRGGYDTGSTADAIRANPKAAAAYFGIFFLLMAAFHLIRLGGFEAVAWPGLCFFVYDFSVARYFGASRRSAFMIAVFMLLGFAALYLIVALSSGGSSWPDFADIVSVVVNAGVSYAAHDTASFLLAPILGVVLAKTNLRLVKSGAPVRRSLLIAVPVLVAMFALHGYYKIIVIAGSFVLSSLVFSRGHCDIYREKQGNLELGKSYMLHMLAVTGVMAIFSWLFS